MEEDQAAPVNFASVNMMVGYGDGEQKQIQLWDNGKRHLYHWQVVAVSVPLCSNKKQAQGHNGWVPLLSFPLLVTPCLLLHIP